VTTSDPIFEAVAELMRSQAAHRRLRNDPIDDETVLALLDLAAHATISRSQRCAFVVVRDPDVRHQLARTYRQGWSVYKRVLRSRAGTDVLLEDRQWESDHFEDVPVLIVACLPGRRPLFPAIGAAAFYGTAFPAIQNLLLAAAARGLGASATTLPLWSVWEARRTLGLPRRVTPVSVVALGWPRGSEHRASAVAPSPLVGNVVHLDRWGHQPFRARRDLAPRDTA
jgi:nitroreductase